MAPIFNEAAGPKIELLQKQVTGWKPLNIFTKIFIFNFIEKGRMLFVVNFTNAFNDLFNRTPVVGLF